MRGIGLARKTAALTGRCEARSLPTAAAAATGHREPPGHLSSYTTSVGISIAS